MKFPHSLQLNAVPEWRDHYIDYGLLKKAIYKFEKSQVDKTLHLEFEANETSSLLSNESSKSQRVHDHIFGDYVNRELEKVIRFYGKKEEELFEIYRKIVPSSKSVDLASENEENHEISAPISPVIAENPKENSINMQKSENLGSANIKRRNSTGEKEIPPNLAKKAGNIGLEKKLTNLFVHLSELQSYAELNWTGIRKALKKYDKVTGNHMQEEFLREVVDTKHPYLKETQEKLTEAIHNTMDYYSQTATGGDQRLASKQLHLHLRQLVSFERNTVWRDMIEQERRTTNIHVVPSLIKAAVQEEKTKIMAKLGWDLTWWRREMFIIPLALVVFIILLFVGPVDTVEARNCLALLSLVSIFWATEVIPIFVTALMVPLLAVLLRVCRKPLDDGKWGGRLDSEDTTKYIFSTMFSPTIMLLLGGFTIASALSKYGIAKLAATSVLSKAGTKPQIILLVNMLVAAFLSMWISNVAAPVLCFSLIQPILRTLPPGSPFAPCLIIGIALASNLGGMASPIASPQNVIAMSMMGENNPGWGLWFAVAIPVVLVSLILIWGLLLLSYKPFGIKLVPIRKGTEKWDWRHYFIIATTMVVIVLWCVENQLQKWVGDMGVIAVIPLLVFFGVGILNKDDFNNFLWTVIILAMGGIALGACVQSSGLLEFIVKHVKTIVQDMSVFGIYSIFACLIVVIATFISHTVAALMIMPVVKDIGASLAEPRVNLFVMSAAMCCSCGMGLIVSGFPNLNAAMLEDEVGKRYLTTKDFLKNGLPSSVIVLGVIISLGYGLMIAIGF